MKKVGFIKLNLQEENFLSKEERKEILGGGVGACYLVCNGDRHPISDCHDVDTHTWCNDSPVVCCSCLGGC